MNWQSIALKSINLLQYAYGLRALEDLNPRHPVLETDVLPTELKTHTCFNLLQIKASQLYRIDRFFTK